MAPGVPGSIHDALTKPNPPLIKTRKIHGSSSCRGFVELESRNMTVWSDFNMTNLLAWSALLKTPYQGRVVDPDIISDSQRLIGDEEKVDDVALQWNVNVLKEPLRAAARAKQPNIDPLRVTVGKRLYTFPNPIRREGTRRTDLKPDMTISIKPTDPRGNSSQATMLVMGDNKYSGAWDYATSWNIIQKRGQTNLNVSIRPYRQIATYCIVGKTRYGYIMSDQELLAVRVYQDKDQAGVNYWGMDVSNPIPWDASSRGLTVNLAIWWLGVMAMNERQRALKPRSKTARINGWYANEGPDGKLQSYTHILTEKTVPVDRKPSEDPVYPRGRGF